MEPRTLYRLPADAGSFRRAGEWLLAAAAHAPVLWVGCSGPEGVPRVAPAQMGHWLGREVQALVFESHAPLAVDALVMAAGLLRGGGALLILDDGVREGAFSRRWQAALADAWVNSLDASCPVAALPAIPASPALPFAWTPDQVAVLERLDRLAPGNCLVLIAPRGRGKSTVLGEYLGAALQRGAAGITLTAPGRGAVDALLQRARQWTRAPDPGEVFMAPDVLRQAPESPDTLMIDEAANLPVDRLLRLARRARRLVLATTTGGFEGSGQGFRLRALPALEGAGFCVRLQTLDTPVRWAPGDPLEDWLNRLFLLEAVSRPPVSQAVRLRWSTGTALADTPQTLEAVMGLLADAHYRTRPSDLARWLDDAGVHLLLLEGAADGALFGVVLIQEEGGLERALAEAVWSGERRPQGHFLPCTVAARGDFDLAGEGAWRIQRIAVHPHWQGQGLGSRLLRAVEDRAGAKGVALIGASFGLQPVLLHLWQRAGYGLVRVGIQPDAASGQVSGVVLRATAPRLQPRLQQALAAFRRDWPAWHPRFLLDTTAAMVSEVLGDQDAKGDCRLSPVDPVADLKEVRAFSQRARPLEWALPALLRQLAVAPPDEPEGQLLEASLAQPIDWDRLARELDVSGRRGVTRRLRRAARNWLEARSL
ncbi:MULTISPECIES: GNAT family N-acetyltransferase [unclassified Thioalkalivibrio]|uniref:GNAT family N-acetyltransferase n=1 Tax=unclassified Thioalkalivibrio TaxID=2621013 RepID=UPI000476F338|nr:MULTISPECIES: GNAT family N-acetyltransferase [unclassified Thioalkalivibrio]